MDPMPGVSQDPQDTQTPLTPGTGPFSETLKVPEGSGPRPDRIGKYPVVRFLGRGGMGDVFLGEHPELRIPVAIKTIRAESARKPAYIDRFLREARVVSQFNHPNIVRIYDADQDHGTYFMIQEFVDGGDVGHLIRSSPGGVLPLPRALDIVTAVARALTVAEKHRIVHRDIKPGNILLTKDGVAKLADLGLAKQYGDDQDGQDGAVTMAGAALGSPAYMAPEQMRNAAAVDTRADIYALGLSFLEMLTGALPRSHSTVKAILTGQPSQESELTARKFPAIPSRVARIVRKMTATEPEDRYQTAPALLTDLERLEVPFHRRHAAGFSIAALTLAVLLGVCTWLAQPKADPLAPVEPLLASSQWDKALEATRPVIEKHRRNARAWYALGICHLERKDAAGFADVQKELATLPEGAEFAAHLTILDLIEKNDGDAALKLIGDWETKAKQRLPFLQSKAVILMQRNDLPKAKECLTAALQAAGFLSYQKLASADALGKLLAAGGQGEKARQLYTRTLQETDRQAVPAAVYTNFAVTLMNNGQNQEAAEQVKLALAANPTDDLALYLDRKLRQSPGAGPGDQIQRTMKMIDEVSGMIRNNKRPDDAWNSRPVVLVFLPFENLNPAMGRLGEDRFWLDSLVTAFRETRGLPVVEREALDAILREQKLSASDLASSEGQMRVGQVLPGSVLVRTAIAGDNGSKTRLTLIDVSTSEIIGTITTGAPVQTQIKGWAESGAQELSRRLADWFPLRGRVSAVDGDMCELSLGAYHGLTAGLELAVYPMQEKPSPRLLARKTGMAKVTVVEADKFTATGRVQDAAEPVMAGMLVLQPKQK